MKNNILHLYGISIYLPTGYLYLDYGYLGLRVSKSELFIFTQNLFLLLCSLSQSIPPPITQFPKPKTGHNLRFLCPLTASSMFITKSDQFYLLNITQLCPPSSISTDTLLQASTISCLDSHKSLLNSLWASEVVPTSLLSMSNFLIMVQ